MCVCEGYMHVWTCVCRYTCLHVHMCRLKAGNWLPSSIVVYLRFGVKFPSLDTELTVSATLAGHQVPSLPSTSARVTGMHCCAQLFMWKLRDLNSGPHACINYFKLELDFNLKTSNFNIIFTVYNKSF